MDVSSVRYVCRLIGPPAGRKRINSGYVQQVRNKYGLILGSEEYLKDFRKIRTFIKSCRSIFSTNFVLTSALKGKFF